MSRASMSFGAVEYGGTHFQTMQGNEPGYATADGTVKLQSITLSAAAVDLIKAGKAIRVLASGDVEAIDGERCGLIVFGNFKGDRPVLGVDADNAV